jgi:hypothetical protein
MLVANEHGNQWQPKIPLRGRLQTYGGSHMTDHGFYKQSERSEDRTPVPPYKYEPWRRAEEHFTPAGLSQTGTDQLLKAQPILQSLPRRVEEESVARPRSTAAGTPSRDLVSPRTGAQIQPPPAHPLECQGPRPPYSAERGHRPSCRTDAGATAVTRGKRSGDPPGARTARRGVEFVDANKTGHSVTAATPLTGAEYPRRMRLA